jgi:CubicO group peptidase (beta-lactamase class C family)
MEALRLTASWPAANVAAAVVFPDGAVKTSGDTHHVFRIASISKMLTGWAALIACEEGIVHLDDPVGQPGCTLRHLLSHAGGYGFDGTEPLSRPHTRRIYSNTGIEMAAAHVERAAQMPFNQYLHEAVFAPLGMHGSSLRSSAAYAVYSCVADLVRFIAELREPRLVSTESAEAFRTCQFPELGGTVPGVGRFDPCPWGLGAELRGNKQPHWTGTRNSPDTYGHFGGAGTLLWVDPGVNIAAVALTDRPFDEWAAEALTLWPAFADEIVAQVTP